MHIEKVNNTFDTYKLTISRGELSALSDALDKVDPSPVTDAMREGVQWYLNNVPGPGEDKKEFIAKKDLAKERSAGPEPTALPPKPPEKLVDPEPLDDLLPPPPGE